MANQAMIENSIIESLKERYKNVHPLIFHRSAERAKTAGELFDILETFPSKYPVVWDDEKHRWKHTDDFTQVEKFNLLGDS